MEQVKVVVVGDGAAGKTSLMITFETGDFPSEWTPTVFDVNALNRMVDGKPVSIRLWYVSSAYQQRIDCVV